MHMAGGGGAQGGRGDARASCASPLGTPLMVPSISNKQKKTEKTEKIVFVGVLKINDENSKSRIRVY